jgi:ABC-2 type transport system permease protein
MFLCFFAFVGFQQISNLGLFNSGDYFVQWLGIQFHYESISRGVIDTRDAAYFLSFIGVFIGLTYLVINSRKW